MFTEKNLRTIRMVSFFFAFVVVFSFIPNDALAVNANLTWEDRSDNEDGFIVEKRAAAGFGEIARTAANTASYSDAAAAPGDCYRVRAFNAVGVSEPSNVACLLMLPSPPAGLTITITVTVIVP